MKQKFLSYYHYGMGGVYFWISADSAEQIDKRFSTIRVIDPWPDWLSEEASHKLPTYDMEVDIAKILKLIGS